MRNLYHKIRPSIVGIITLYLILVISGVSAEGGSASVYVSPSSGAFSQDFNVDVLVSSADEEINSISGTISFPSDKMRVVSLSTSGSIVDTWIAGPTFSNATGEISYGGITLFTPFMGINGKVLTIKFRPVGSGNATINFASASVLANDLVGTELLAGAGGGNYSLTASGEPIPVEETVPKVEEIVPVEEYNPFANLKPVKKIVLGAQETIPVEEISPTGNEPAISSTPEPVVEKPVAIEEPSNDITHASAPSQGSGDLEASFTTIESANKGVAKYLPERPKVFSPTHPDPEIAYANNYPTFTWGITNDITGVNFLADQNPDTLLGEKSHGRFTTYTYEDVADGEWYFHIRLQNASGWGNTTHRKFIIDSSKSGNMEDSWITTTEEMQIGENSEAALKPSATDVSSYTVGDNTEDAKTVESSIAPTKVKKDLWLKWEFIKKMPLTYIAIILLLIVVIAESFMLINVLFKGKGKKRR